MIFNAHTVAETLNKMCKGENRIFHHGHSFINGQFVEEITGINNVAEYMKVEKDIVRVYLEKDMDTTISRCVEAFNI